MSTTKRPVAALAVLLLMLLVAGSPPSAQQDEADDEDVGWGKIVIELGAWAAQPDGLGYHPATLNNPQDAFDTTLLSPEHEANPSGYYRVGFELSRNVGALIGTWFATEDDAAMSPRQPGDFVYGEVLAHPLYAGYQNDGLADGFDFTANTTLRDLRLDFYRVAFRSSRVVGKWFAGYRRVNHNRSADADYYGLVPAFPPLVPPVTPARPDLDPLPDTVVQESRYEGRGLEAGMEFHVPLWRDRISIDAGFALAVLRGKIDTEYRSTTHFYAEVDPSTGRDIRVIDPPYDEFGDFTVDPTGQVDAFVDDVRQRDFMIGLNSDSLSRNSQVQEVFLGFNWKALKFLEVFLGFRNTRYTDVGIDLRPVNVVLDSSTNLVNVTETDRSAEYEGFYGGVRFRF